MRLRACECLPTQVSGRTAYWFAIPLHVPSTGMPSAPWLNRHVDNVNTTLTLVSTSPPSSPLQNASPRLRYANRKHLLDDEPFAAMGPGQARGRFWTTTTGMLNISNRNFRVSPAVDVVVDSRSGPTNSDRQWRKSTVNDASGCVQTGVSPTETPTKAISPLSRRHGARTLTLPPLKDNAAVPLLPLTPSPTLNFHVMFVDDEEINRDIGNRILRRIGCTTCLLADGIDVERALLSSDVHVHVIMLDIQMSQLNGDVLCRILRSQGHRAPIIAMTGEYTPCPATLPVRVSANAPIDALFFLPSSFTPLPRCRHCRNQ
jgi:CheY-like chemotaxis protein